MTEFCKVTNKSTVTVNLLNYHAATYFDTIVFIFREFIFITSPSYISISIAAVGNTV